MVLLAAASGAVDATAFKALGHVFAGVMTGNLALLGIAVGNDHFADTVPPLISLAGFIAGTATAARLCRGRTEHGTKWPSRTVQCLAFEAALLAAVAVVWTTTGSPPSGALRMVLLCAVAVAMGAQSGAMLGAGNVAHPSTYMTGSLTTFITHSAARVPGGPLADPWVPARLAALAVGAGAAVAVLRYAAGWTPFLAPLLVVGAIVVAVRGGRPQDAPAAVPGDGA